MNLKLNKSKKPITEGFYAYKDNDGVKTIVYLEFREDSRELYSFAIGFIGGVLVSTMHGKWSDEIILKF